MHTHESPCFCDPLFFGWVVVGTSLCGCWVLDSESDVVSRIFVRPETSSTRRAHQPTCEACEACEAYEVVCLSDMVAALLCVLCRVDDVYIARIII